MKSKDTTVVKQCESENRPCCSIFYVEAMALALCRYTEVSQPFRAWLHLFLTESKIAPTLNPNERYGNVSVDLLKPADDEIAALRATWLIEQLLTGTLPGSAHASEILGALLTSTGCKAQPYQSLLPEPSFDPEGALRWS